MWSPRLDSLRRAAGRFNRLFRASEPLTYRDAWRYSAVFPVVLLPQAVLHALLRNAVWPVLLALAVPAMAAFTFGFAAREGTVGQRALSLAVGLLGAAAPLALAPVRRAAVALGAPGVLLLWLVGLVGLLGYAFPEYGPGVTDGGHDAPGSGS